MPFFKKVLTGSIITTRGRSAQKHYYIHSVNDLVCKCFLIVPQCQKPDSKYYYHLDEIGDIVFTSLYKIEFSNILNVICLVYPEECGRISGAYSEFQKEKAKKRANMVSIEKEREKYKGLHSIAARSGLRKCSSVSGNYYKLLNGGRVSPK